MARKAKIHYHLGKDLGVWELLIFFSSFVLCFFFFLLEKAKFANIMGSTEIDSVFEVLHL